MGWNWHVKKQLSSHNLRPKFNSHRPLLHLQPKVSRDTNKATGGGGRGAAGDKNRERRSYGKSSSDTPLRVDRQTYGPRALHLGRNADAVEFCPHDLCSNVLAASTYVLQEGDQPSRSGSISLFNVNADAGLLELIQKVETAGIFDIKWSPRLYQDHILPLLAQADADGYVRIYSQQCLDSDGSEMQGNCINEVCGKQISSSMCLCIDWNPSATEMAVGLSDGSVYIVSLHESHLNVLQEWKAHEFELWAALFDIQQPKLVYTGADDCKFTCWGIRDSPPNLAFKNSKAHKMGVCCIAKSPSDSHTVLTGSYDEYLRAWDVRSTSKPVSECCLGGGVWRIKHHPVVPGLVLTAACMHNGFAIVRLGGDGVKVVERYDGHGSLAYGADWQKGRNSSCPVVASCSRFMIGSFVFGPPKLMCFCDDTRFIVF